MDLFITTFVALFVIVDPLGVAAVFSGLTVHTPHKNTCKIALRAFFMAACILVFFGFFGGFILNYLGIEAKSFKIAGGLLLFYTAFRMVLGGHENSTKFTQKDDDIAIYPLAVPLLAGPGVITALLLFLDEANNRELSVMYIVIALVLVQILALFTLISASYIRRVLGVGTLSVSARITGVLLAALSVQFVMDGLGF